MKCQILFSGRNKKNINLLSGLIFSVKVKRNNFRMSTATIFFSIFKGKGTMISWILLKGDTDQMKDIHMY